MKIKQNKMLGYLAVTAGVGCAASTANAAVVFYGNASNNNLQADPAGLSLTLQPNPYGGAYGNVSMTMGGVIWASAQVVFTRGEDLVDVSNVSGPQGGVLYHGSSGFVNGAVVGCENYANISFNGNDGPFEAVAQFYFDGVGGVYLKAIATMNPIPNPQNLSAVGGPALSISAGKAMIAAAAAVPEPSGLMLLALGATGLAARRQRKKAA